MTNLAAGHIAFLSWTRQGLAGELLMDPGALSVAGRLQLPIRVNLQTRRGTGSLVSFPVADAPTVQLYGPMDVAGIDVRQVIRTEPVALTSNFESNLFPLVEFDRPDLPWMFSPTPPVHPDRWQPWITLVVLPKAAAQVTAAADATKALPSIDCPVAELPRLDDAWAWAHVQLIQGSISGDHEALLDDAARSLSRLIAARRLDARTAYVACVVPTYELGRRAGLGQAITTSDLDHLAITPAWSDSTAAADRVTLPVYFHWEFTTGEGGDFKSLAKSLTANREVPEGLGEMAIDVSMPGWGTPAAADQPLPMHGAPQPLPMHGALQAASDTPHTTWRESESFSDRLLQVLNEPQKTTPPLIGPPIYGQNYLQLTGLDRDAAPRWLTELNLGIERRIAAGLGALVVRFEQEPLMAAAWDQLAELERRNQERKRQQLAESVSVASLAKARHTMPALGGMAVTQVEATAWSPTMTRLARRDHAAIRRSTVRPEQSHPQVNAMLDTVRALAANLPTASLPQQGPAAVAVPAEHTTLLTFAPSFGTPVSELLAEYFPAYLLPGMEKIAPNSVTLLQTNPSFVEAFLVGLNHEMAREMLWRGYPADPRGTYFRTFWDRRSPDGTSTVADIEPIAQWSETSLGSHSPADVREDADFVMLLIRGDLLKRYPRAAIYAEHAQWQGGVRALDGQQRQPLFLMTQTPDITLAAFDLSTAKVRGADTPDPGQDPGWFFVLQELPSEPRFGLAPPDDSFGGNPAAWRDLAWSDLVPSADALKAMRYLPLDAGPAVADNTAVWAASSAEMALITRQAPFRLAIHGRVWF
jgi:hypothetical protein